MVLDKVASLNSTIYTLLNGVLPVYVVMVKILYLQFKLLLKDCCIFFDCKCIAVDMVKFYE